MRDYQIETATRVTIAEVFNANTSRNISIRVFRGPFHYLRAALWSRWNTRVSLNTVRGA